MYVIVQHALVNFHSSKHNDTAVGIVVWIYGWHIHSNTHVQCVYCCIVQFRWRHPVTAVAVHVLVHNSLPLFSKSSLQYPLTLLLLSTSLLTTLTAVTATVVAAFAIVVDIIDYTCWLLRCSRRRSQQIAVVFDVIAAVPCDFIVAVVVTVLWLLILPTSSLQYLLSLLLVWTSSTTPADCSDCCRCSRRRSWHCTVVGDVFVIVVIYKVVRFRLKYFMKQALWLVSCLSVC